jgi:hypothetical protein
MHTQPTWLIDANKLWAFIGDVVLQSLDDLVLVVRTSSSFLVDLHSHNAFGASLLSYTDQRCALRPAGCLAGPVKLLSTI